MALETLCGLEVIRGEAIGYSGVSPLAWGKNILITPDDNMISFRLQKGPIKEVGKNGCQVVDMIAMAKLIIERLNEQFPCRENAMVITKLDEAILWSDKRTSDRIARNVEGKSEL